MLVLPLPLYEIIRHAPEWKPLEEVARELGSSVDSLMRYVEEGRAKGVLRVERKVIEFYELTEEGRQRAAEGLPEYKLLKSAVCREGRCTAHLSQHPEAQIALANLAKLGVKPRGNVVELDEETYKKIVAMLEEKQKALAAPHSAPPEVLKEFIKRKLVRKIEKTQVYVKAAVPLELVKPAEVKTVITSEDIATGRWRNYTLKPFDLNIEPPEYPAPVPHFFNEFLDYVREVMIGLGFEEVRGPVLEVEFWNFDALFQAQDHPAREVHDTFYVQWSGPLETPPEHLMESVGRVHEEKWRYKWDRKKALNPVLRTQTTATTIRALAERGDGEYKVFTIGRVFRPEKLDPKHSMEFHQLDGIVVGPGLTFKHLLGQLEEIAKALGMTKVKFRPAYFPFTSPSVEVYAQHPKLGWVEFGGAGIFRPEVTEPLGVKKSRVLAWGWGLDRIAMILLGIDDIRELFTKDLEKLKEYYARWARYKASVGAVGTLFTL
ncbi:phenylalanine--tRNA ligase subunit alpha [Pyrobaculum aerophilum]|mgnify:FL=1|uniref:Phenylalanine--tRNA ligase alpha subunit n=2 Tax=Pyrobaculum aerophilum TaxID=13773 RepID=SYFA_PYRAE|nr:phenylalanine--tRNA ligase subunit alpha [Pyrobaculum aerophilum]Q8ZX61.1 RecName: Full=Phenylalanine--tRNA ligase alpha subunit; AltName: Full=Phenylalanyl-tRNA synthetase alpha subunit; Short=PheRS [Pyrobaculum aerophilum str. IM2]AAL63488.1 phenylalanyl-tRNA synthetase alpha subunit [Pyrobaculum aerophilum str. IM2]MCX8135956.1 phenylalanine--tRNA ligase subunit alpha [Pyrobaculum aerophilum]HII46362.1 phenylalanine--tRNA ligase subunit alpha [Pyrobaculum aerophilum]